MMRSRWILAAAAASAALVLALNGCSSSNATETKGKQGGKPGSAPGAGGKKVLSYPVRVVSVATSPVTYDINAIGSVEAFDVYHIHARVPGTIYDVKFNEGDEVNPEQVLCTIAPEAYRFAHQRAKAQYEQAVANLADFKRKSANAIERARIDLARAEVEITRRKGVKDLGAISDEEIQLYEARRDLAAVELKDMREAAVTEQKALEAAVLEREATWKIAEDDLRKSTVKPPIKGVIEKRSVTNMVFVTAGTELATIVDRSQLKLKFKVAERDAGAVREGVKVNFHVPAFPGKKFEADIYHVESLLDVEARTLTCWAKVTKDAELLRPGYFASVNIVTKVNKEAVVVPASAVLPTEKGFQAYVVEDGKAVRRTVRTGLSVTDNSIEILEGLNPGEQLVIEGANALLDGVSVMILDGAPGSPGKPVDSGSKQEAKGGKQ
ncbi:MAG TPA: efflux RND transporter periplasmic adaptor subunit [Planctomycetota bacterium]|nr:efflux RND transporter periplasmic adaptor subunit [Planctomycetota bacterium]